MIEKDVPPMPVCYMNGQFLPIGECALPVTDMAVQRGAAVFESIRCYDRRLMALERHLARLENSAAGARITAGEILSALPQIIKDGARLPEVTPDGLVKPYITGGDVNDKGRFPKPRFFVIFDEIHKTGDAERKSGAVLEPNPIERPYPLFKSVNYLFGLIPLGCGSPAAHESLYMPEGEITESMTNNFFLCRGRKIITAPVGRVLDGVTRGIVLELAREIGFSIEERCPRIGELQEADEAFITGKVNEVLAVTKIGDITIGNGRPGPVSSELYRAFLKEMPRWLS